MADKQELNMRHCAWEANFKAVGNIKRMQVLKLTWKAGLFEVRSKLITGELKYMGNSKSTVWVSPMVLQTQGGTYAPFWIVKAASNAAQLFPFFP